MKGEIRSPAMVIFLSIITCGIYSLYWIYKLGTELQLYLNDYSINPSMNVVLSILCPPFWIYVLYRYCQNITEAQRRAGIMPEDNSVAVLLLCIFGLGIVAVAIMQSSINRVWEANA
ncbi:MAG: DUF4234 domain-containing protein [Clostridia bacterium]|nr:DUF4234 domain-containing protein [Clostridia bacterium]